MKCICDPSLCTGCGVCSKSCNNGNISLSVKKNGFYYPQCETECQLCTFVCPQNTQLKQSKSKFSYALQLLDEEDLLESTSGGAFFAISKYVLSNNGVIYGAVYDSDLKVKHVCAQTYEELKPMHGSKYIYSDIVANLNDVERYLASGRMVFVVGLPCQIAGVVSRFGNHYSNLITADLICNGVPSYKLWNAYIRNLEYRHRIKVLDYKFRDKHRYGVSHTTVIRYMKNGKERQKTIKNRREITYYEAFGKQNCLNDVCYNCRYNTIERISDFTLGGFWAINEVETNLNPQKGVSLVLANTGVAEEILEKLSFVCVIEKYPIEIASRHNPALVRNTDSKKIDLLFDVLDEEGYERTASLYFPSIGKIRGILSNSRFIKWIYQNTRKRH